MGDKDFIKPLLERRGTVFFGKASALSPLFIKLLYCCLPDLPATTVCLLERHRVLRKGGWDHSAVLCIHPLHCHAMLCDAVLCQDVPCHASVNAPAPTCPLPIHRSR